MPTQQAPPLDHSGLSAAEAASLRASDEILQLLVRALKANADRYSPRLQKALSDPKAETKVEVTFGNEKVYSALLDKDHNHKVAPVNNISDSQARFLQEAFSKQKGESLDNPTIQNMRVFVNGEKLYELKEGKVIQNDLPPQFTKTMSDMLQPKPLDLSYSATPAFEPQQPQAKQEVPVEPRPAQQAEREKPKTATASPSATASTTPVAAPSAPTPEAEKPPVDLKNEKTPTVPVAAAPVTETPTASEPVAKGVPAPVLKQTQIPPDFGINAAQGIDAQKVQATGDSMLIATYGQSERLRSDLNSTYERANNPGFEYLRKDPEVAKQEGELALLTPQLDRRLNTAIEEGKYPAPPQASREVAAEAQSTVTPGLDRSFVKGEWVPTSHQDDLNASLVKEGKDILSRVSASQPVGDRTFDHSNFKLTQKDGVFTTQFKNSNTRVQEKDGVISGNSRQPDVDFMKQVKRSFKNEYQNSASATNEMEAGE
jgi:hypothetical protein